MAKRKELDKETQKVESIGNAIKELVGSTGWAEARRRLIRKATELQLIGNIDIQNATGTDLVSLIAAKTTAARILLEWLRDIEGTAEQHDANKELITQTAEDIVMNVD